MTDPLPPSSEGAAVARDHSQDGVADASEQAAGVWDEVIGTVYTTASLASALHTTTDRVIADADELRILRAYTTDGVAVYPKFQVANGQVAPGLQVVLLVLRSGIDDPWTWAQWLTSEPAIPAADIVPRRHIDRLHDGDAEEVIRAAGHTAASWIA